jgi:hypothetical protein
MSLDKLVEEMLREAIARGDFDDLPGKGKPQNLDGYFAAPEEMRAAVQLLKDAGFVPEEVQLLKDIAALKEQMTAASGDEVARLKKILDEKTLAFNVLMDRKRIRRSPRSQ